MAGYSGYRAAPPDRRPSSPSGPCASPFSGTDMELVRIRGRHYIKVYIHGACYENQPESQFCLAGATVLFWCCSPYNEYAAEVENPQTNNRAYLTAAIKALETITQIRDPRNKFHRSVAIYTNSEYPDMVWNKAVTLVENLDLVPQFRSLGHHFDEVRFMHAKEEVDEVFQNTVEKSRHHMGVKVCERWGQEHHGFYLEGVCKSYHKPGCGCHFDRGKRCFKCGGPGPFLPVEYKGDD